MGIAAVAIATDLDRVPAPQVDEWCQSLSAPAQARAATFGSVRRYRQFVAGRYLLAQLLAAELELPPQAIIPQLSEHPDGRPRLRGSDIECSISHSGSAVMAGFSQLASLGVDIEQHRRRNFQRLVAAYFHPDEYRAFTLLQPDQQSDWFYRMWTRKEAGVKAKGEGLTLQSLSSPIDSSLHSLAVDIIGIPGYTACVLHHCPVIVPRFQASYLAKAGQICLLPHN